jgi:hypothetical protein
MAKVHLSTALVLCFVATASHAATMEQMAQEVVNARGHDCPRVTKVKPLGTTESKTPIVAVACSNGKQHVLTIQRDDTFKYLSSCSAFEATTKTKCF